jgi:hypothetical protein
MAKSMEVKPKLKMETTNYEKFLSQVAKMRSAQQRFIEQSAQAKTSEDIKNARQILLVSKQLEDDVDDMLWKLCGKVEKPVGKVTLSVELSNQIEYIKSIRVWHEDLRHPLEESSHVIGMCKAIEHNLSLLDLFSKMKTDGTN